MKKHLTLRLSFWAKKHRPAAITIIAAAKIAIGVAGFCFGIFAALEGFLLPLETKWPLATLAAIGILAYPAKRLKKRLGRAVFYRRQKRVDFGLVILGFVLLFFAGNLTPVWVKEPEFALSRPGNTAVAFSCLQKNTTEIQLKSVKKKTKIGLFKRWIFAKAKAERVVARIACASEDADDTSKVVLSILLALLGAGLAFLVAGLSCSLSCSGEEGLAVFVAVFGLTGIVIGLVLGFRAIWRTKADMATDRRHEKKKPPTKTEKRPPTNKKE